MASQTAIGSSKIPIALPYGTLSVANAPGTLNTPTASIKEYTMAKGGWVIGMGANLSGTLTTGTLQFTPTKNGTPMTGTFANGTINIGTLSNYERDQAQNPLLQFQDGDTIGVMYGITGTIAPTTRDCEVLLLVLLNNYDY